MFNMWHLLESFRFLYIEEAHKIFHLQLLAHMFRTENKIRLEEVILLVHKLVQRIQKRHQLFSHNLGKGHKNHHR